MKYLLVRPRVDASGKQDGIHDVYAELAGTATAISATLSQNGEEAELLSEWAKETTLQSGRMLRVLDRHSMATALIIEVPDNFVLRVSAVDEVTERRLVLVDLEKNAAYPHERRKKK